MREYTEEDRHTSKPKRKRNIVTITFQGAENSCGNVIEIVCPKCLVES